MESNKKEYLYICKLKSLDADCMYSCHASNINEAAFKFLNFLFDKFGLLYIRKLDMSIERF